MNIDDENRHADIMRFVNKFYGTYEVGAYGECSVPSCRNKETKRKVVKYTTRTVELDLCEKHMREL